MSSVRHTSLAQHISNGIRTVLAAMPGSSIIAPFLDIAFRSFGLSVASRRDTKSPNTIQMASSFFGVGAVFEILPANLGAGSTLGIVVTNPYTATHPGFRSWAPRAPFLTVSNLTVRFVPTNEQRYLSGMVAMSWVPYTTDSAREWYRAIRQVPTYRDVVAIPGAIQGRPTDPLLLRCVLSGYSALPRKPDEPLGLVFCAFIDNARSGSSQLSPADFSGEFEVSGTIHTIGGYPHEFEAGQFTAGKSTYDDVIPDHMADLGARLERSYGGHRLYSKARGGLGLPPGFGPVPDDECDVTLADGYTCEIDPATGLCIVTGEIIPSEPGYCVVPQVMEN